MGVRTAVVSIGYNQEISEVRPAGGVAITCDDAALPTLTQLAAIVARAGSTQDTAAYGNGRSASAQVFIKCKEFARCRLRMLGGHATAIDGKKAMVQVAFLREEHNGNIESTSASKMLEFEVTFGSNIATAHVPYKVALANRALFVQAAFAESFDVSPFDETRGGAQITGSVADGNAGIDFDTENCYGMLVSVTMRSFAGADDAAKIAAGADCMVFIVEWL